MSNSSRLFGEEVQVPNAPPVAGLSFRRTRDKPDFRALADVIQRSRDADEFELVDTAEDLTEEFNHLQNCTPSKDMLYVFKEHELIGFCRSEWRTREDGLRTYEHSACLVPEHRVDGLRQAMLRENERRIREVSRKHPKDIPKMLEVRTSITGNDWQRLLESEGYRPFRYSYLMLRNDLEGIPDLPIPDGLEIRPYAPEQFRTIFYACEEAFKDEPGYNAESWSEEAMKSFSAWRGCTPDKWIIAWDVEEVAGGVFDLIDREENSRYRRNWGYLMVVFVRRAYRRKGLAKALIAKGLELLKEEGVRQAALGVDYENPSGANKLYESMGFHVRDKYARYRKDLY